ncbi:hypothetical protein [Pedobacter sp. N23S346]|uniref:hypothetical protein n=1 Tax=Pedobacter sp. N23S346 TaxID=3402750 RepID=UPI003AD5412E
MNNIALISHIVKTYFDVNPSVKIILAKDLMPLFIRAEIFVKDDKNGLPIRRFLRDLDKKGSLHLLPHVLAKGKLANTRWFFQRDVPVVNLPKSVQQKTSTHLPVSPAATGRNRDEDYVLNLCDELLKLQGSRQHKFDFLLGDTNRKLPVDIYYSELKLVVEYREYQHNNAVKHFDKPDKMTASGVHRGEQRKIYDQRRRDVLPAKGIKLVEIDYTDFEHDRSNRIVKDKVRDLMVVENKISIRYGNA